MQFLEIHVLTLVYLYFCAHVTFSSKDFVPSNRQHEIRPEIKSLKPSRTAKRAKYVLHSGQYVAEGVTADRKKISREKMINVGAGAEWNHEQGRKRAKVTVDSEDSDELLKVLQHPVVGLPNDEEMDDIYDRYRRGLPLTFRQSVWLDATSDFTCRGPVDLEVRMPADNDTGWMDDNVTDIKKRREWPYLCHRRLLGCGNLANCSDCRVRYQGVEFLSPDDERARLDAQQFTTLRKNSFRQLLRRVEEVCAAPDDDPFWTRDDGDSSRNENQTEEELTQEARNVVLQRLASATLVSDDQLRYALSVLNPKRSKDRRYSRRELIELVTRLRKRMMRAPNALYSVVAGDMLEARVLRVRAYGAVVGFPALEAQEGLKGLHGLLHLSQVELHRCPCFLPQSTL